MIKIVKAEKKHLGGLIRSGKSHWNHEWLNRKYLESTLDGKGAHFVVLDGARVVGGIMVLELDHPKFWIFYFAVDKNYQRRGIGTMLLQRACKKISKGKLLFVDLADTDKTGIDFYRKTGFNKMGAVKSWFENDVTAIIMAKKL